MVAPQHLSLADLGPTSATKGTWLVRVQHGSVEHYEYMSKQGTKVRSTSFKCKLVGEVATDYVGALFRGSDDKVKKTQDKLTDGSVWIMSKVSLDNKADAAHQSSTIKVLVLLSGTTVMTPVAAASLDPKRAPALFLVPKVKIGDLTHLTGAAAVDCIGLVEECTDPKEVTTIRGTRTVFTIVVYDDSGADDNKKNEVTITVWCDDDTHHKTLQEMVRKC